MLDLIIAEIATIFAISAEIKWFLISYNSLLNTKIIMTIKIKYNIRKRSENEIKKSV